MRTIEEALRDAFGPSLPASPFADREAFRAALDTSLPQYARWSGQKPRDPGEKAILERLGCETDRLRLAGIR